MPTDEMVEKARKIADDMFFGPHKPECGIPEDQTMTVRYGNAVRVIAAALEAAEAGAVPVGWWWEWNSGGTGKWMTTIGMERPEDHPQRRNITPLYASPPSEAVQAAYDQLVDLQPHIAQLPERNQPFIDTHVDIAMEHLRSILEPKVDQPKESKYDGTR